MARRDINLVIWRARAESPSRVDGDDAVGAGVHFAGAVTIMSAIQLVGEPSHVSQSNEINFFFCIAAMSITTTTTTKTKENENTTLPFPTAATDFHCKVKGFWVGLKIKLSSETNLKVHYAKLITQETLCSKYLDEFSKIF